MVPDLSGKQPERDTGGPHREGRSVSFGRGRVHRVESTGASDIFPRFFRRSCSQLTSVEHKSKTFIPISSYLVDMNVRELFTDDSAVSPVIGVILMVAVTVILAAVIGSFVLNLGGSLQQNAPQATFSFDYEQNEGGSDALEITHDAGDTIEGENLNVSSTGATDKTTGDDTEDAYVGTDVFTGSVTSGTSVTVDNTTFKTDGEFMDERGGPDEKLDLSDATVRVVYNSDNGENSATLSTWEAPDA